MCKGWFPKEKCASILKVMHRKPSRKTTRNRYSKRIVISPNLYNELGLVPLTRDSTLGLCHKVRRIFGMRFEIRRMYKKILKFEKVRIKFVRQNWPGQNLSLCSWKSSVLQWLSVACGCFVGGNPAWLGIARNPCIGVGCLLFAEAVYPPKLFILRRS